MAAPPAPPPGLRAPGSVYTARSASAPPREHPGAPPAPVTSGCGRGAHLRRWRRGGAGPASDPWFGASLEGFLWNPLQTAWGAPRSTGCLVLARTDCRGVASTRGNSFALSRNQNSVLQGPLNVFSRLIRKEMCTQTRTSSCVRAPYKCLHYDIWLELMLYDLKWPVVVLLVGFEVLFCILSCGEIEPRVVLFRHVTTEPQPPPCLESRGPAP